MPLAILLLLLTATSVAAQFTIRRDKDGHLVITNENDRTPARAPPPTIWERQQGVVAACIEKTNAGVEASTGFDAAPARGCDGDIDAIAITLAAP